eukprot:gene1957-biopygen65
MGIRQPHPLFARLHTVEQYLRARAPTRPPSFSRVSRSSGPSNGKRGGGALRPRSWWGAGTGGSGVRPRHARATPATATSMLKLAAKLGTLRELLGPAIPRGNSQWQARPRHAHATPAPLA